MAHPAPGSFSTTTPGSTTPSPWPTWPPATHVEIVAVTATPGNVDADQVAANNRALLALCGQPQVPVLIGAREPLRVPLITTQETHGPQGVGYATLPDPGPATAQARCARRH